MMNVVDYFWRLTWTPEKFPNRYKMNHIGDFCVDNLDKCRGTLYVIRSKIYESYLLPKILMSLVGRFYKIKDNQLANKLHEFAGRYQSRPTDGWTPPPEWECWTDQQ